MQRFKSPGQAQDFLIGSLGLCSKLGMTILRWLRQVKVSCE
jgi:hypothetical protein